jgi:hypothetical protein
VDRDAGAHGRFNKEAKSRSLYLEANMRRPAVAITVTISAGVIALLLYQLLS